MYNDHFIIMKINSASIAYGIINCDSIVFYGQDGTSKKNINLSGMLDDIIDIPYYFKSLFEKGMDAVSTAEEIIYDEDDYYDEMEYGQIPFLQFIQNAMYKEQNELNTFNLDNSGTQLIIKIIPQQNDIYYNFTIVNYNRLFMDMVINPLDMLYVDMKNNYMHTMEIGHNNENINMLKIVKFIYPNIDFKNKQNNVIYD